MGTHIVPGDAPELPEMDPDDDEQELVVMEPPTEPTDVPLDQLQQVQEASEQGGST